MKMKKLAPIVKTKSTYVVVSKRFFFNLVENRRERREREYLVKTRPTAAAGDIVSLGSSRQWKIPRNINKPLLSCTIIKYYSGVLNSTIISAG